MLERYKSDLCTFYTPIGELGLALHEMQVVSGLSWGNIPYEERYLPLLELNELKRKNIEMYEIYWELLCHFYICLDSQKGSSRSKGIGYLSWASYLCPHVKGTRNVERLSARTIEKIEHQLPDVDRS